jgi:hypothetical protein
MKNVDTGKVTPLVHDPNVSRALSMKNSIEPFYLTSLYFSTSESISMHGNYLISGHYMDLS